MLTTERKPATVGEILVEEFMQPMGLNPGRAGGGEGRSAQARQRAVQHPPDRDGGDRAHPRARVRQ